MRRSSDERRAEIVATVMALADELGPDRLTTSTIAERIGLSHAAVFRHFPSKQAIWEAVVGWIGERLDARWAAVEQAPAPERLRGLLRRHLELVQANPAIPTILLSRELHARNDVLRRGLRMLMMRFHGRLSALIEQGRDEGSFRADLDPGRAAFLIIGLVQGLVVRWSLTGRDFDLQAELDPMLDMLTRGFAAPEA